MIDKPVPAKILLSLINKKYSGKEFISLSVSLYHQNLIFAEPRELRKKNEVLEMIVIFRDVFSYKNWLKNSEIIEYWHAKFDKYLTEKPKTIKEVDVILEVDKIKNCMCKKSEYYILEGRRFLCYDELNCNRCLGQIPYSKIPLEIRIEEWQTFYERVFSNWLNSDGLYERGALRELKNYKKGKLNREGEKIRKQLSDYFKIPVYISYFEEDPNENQNCLLCGSSGNKSGLKRPSRVCKACNTIFGYDPDA